MNARLQSFRNAFQGIKVALREEPNLRIHLVAAIAAIAAGVYFQIRFAEWAAVSLAIGLVIVAEILNSAIETLCDFVSPGKNEIIGKTKDLAAAAVLVAAGISLAVAGFVFLPKIF